MNKNRIRVIITVLADIILLILFVAFIPALLRERVGFDVTEYENWDGALADPFVLQFGAGCWENAIIVVKMTAFLIIQSVLFKKRHHDRKILTGAVIAHVAVFALGMAYIYKFADGAGLIYLLECLWE